ncbi:hypothetical protein [Streptomyces johnsoniae]|uniref:Uncharacterized protein n=1 Tax=Streptomyces johnsoniae TaxID=3075532 RepID=A0ABU2SCV0_9ACTN|nr:hypothetical protein [Streptomyces sp. DSM 41886]MDT0446802.1 hypothetical protein [Streptomyces sp. DSM 41886]
MARFALRRAEHGAQECVVKVARVPRCGLVQTPRPAVLIARVGPGDGGEVVLTLRLRGE